MVVDYGQRHRAELQAAERLARARAVESHRVVHIDLRSIGGSALTADIPVPAATEVSAAPKRLRRIADRVIPVTYVPARNLVFLSVAASLAEVVGAEAIFIGVNTIDYSGYPDCGGPFIRAFERCATKGTRVGTRGKPIRVMTPLIRMSKAEIIRAGDRLGLDLGLTHSCYNPTRAGLACGKCDACAIRARGFVQAGIPDTTRYAKGSPPVPAIKPPQEVASRSSAARSMRAQRRPTGGRSRSGR